MVEVGRGVENGGRGDESKVFWAVWGGAERDAGEGGEDICGFHFGVGVDPVDAGATVNYYINRVFEVFPGRGGEAKVRFAEVARDAF